MGFYPAKFGLPKPIRSRVMLRHGTDGRTNGQTDTAANFIMPPSLRGRRNNKKQETDQERRRTAFTYFGNMGTTWSTRNWCGSSGSVAPIYAHVLKWKVDILKTNLASGIDRSLQNTAIWFINNLQGLPAFNVDVAIMSFVSWTELHFVKQCFGIFK